MLQSSLAGSDKVLKILYLITSTTIGGTERSLLETCRRLDRSRFLPTVVSLKREGAVAREMRGLGVEVLSLGMRQSADWISAAEFAAGLLRLPRLLAGRSFELAHSFLYRANLFGRLIPPRLRALGLINSVRVTAEEEGALMRLVDARTAGRVDVFCVLSGTLAADLRGRLGLAPRRVEIIPNGIDVAAADGSLREGRESARGLLNLSPADLVVTAVGRLHRQKGFDVLLEALRPFCHEHPRCRLLLLGDGPERAALERRTGELGLGEHVLFLGAMPSPWTALAAADIFALPSRWEGMPNALLEAMAASLPVVASTVGAVPEMVDDGKEGILVPPDDPESLLAALERLAWEGDLRRHMGRLGRLRVERDFTVDASTGRLESLYLSFADGRRGAPR